MSGPEYGEVLPKAICHECGKPLYTDWGAYARYGKLFCSYACTEKWALKNATETPPPVCEVCGSHINPDYQRGPICGACLKEKEDTLRGKNNVCAVCGAPLGSAVYRFDGISYCSAKCVDKALVHDYPADPVLSPSHYTAGGIETIDFIRAKLTPDEFRGFLKGSIIKYISRANLKGSEEQDYRKASFYSRMLTGDDPRKEAE